MPSFNQKLSSWYQRNKRDLPWRQDKNPYKIWLSEVLLQQTRIEQGLPYFNRFSEKYPSVGDLAKAEEEEVLSLWQGLGYYSRARNMLKAAKEVSQNRKGQFPKSASELAKLPGIGPYTASAISSIAFGEKTMVVDGNVIRFFSRLHGLEHYKDDPKLIQEIKDLGQDLMVKPYGDFNQALMEFGSLICTPKNPKCRDCPFSESCVALLGGRVNELPAKKPPKPKKERQFVYFLIQEKDSIWVRKRTQKDIWQNMFELPGMELPKPYDNPLNLLKQFENENLSQNAVLEDLKPIKHVLSHQILFAKFVILNSEKIPSSWWKNQRNLESVKLKDLNKLPFPQLIANFLKSRFQNYGRR